VSDVVRLERDAGIARVTLNRPERMNALDHPLAEALADTLARLEQERELRVVVLRGAGGGFMAGGDVKLFHEGAQAGPAEIRRRVEALIAIVHRAILTIHRMPQIVISSVHGAVAGFGLSLMMATDLTLAAEGTRFTLAYSKIGTSPDGSSTWSLPRLVGLKRASEIALLADVFDAGEALRLGLVNRVVAADALEAQTQALAERLARGPAIAYARTKALLRGAHAASLETQLQREQEAFAECAVTQDFAEGTAAFVEKREARFRGR
jgi:2-(1,2-epoxy-1,2-dihydrophenyl)acetyl-CoA isomerase